MTAERCAQACVRRGDPVGASAPPVRSWLLVEQPGPWGRDALHQSRLPADVAGAVAAQAAEIGARVLLIRAPGRDSDTGPRRWALVDSRPGAERSWWSEFTDPAELCSLNLAEPKGTPSTEPFYLVCAHGKHDTCCAVRGRPVAAALAATRPGRVWECSHVGGDRFAANLLVLPHGLYYGQVDTPEGPRIADAHEAGLLTPDRLRGRSAYTAPAQAAQQFARERFGDHRVSAFAPVRVEHTGHERWDVILEQVPERAADDPAPLVVSVRAVFHRSDTPLTCSATVPAAIRHFELTGIR